MDFEIKPVAVSGQGDPLFHLVAPAVGPPENGSGSDSLDNVECFIRTLWCDQLERSRRIVQWHRLYQVERLAVITIVGEQPI